MPGFQLDCCHAVFIDVLTLMPALDCFQAQRDIRVCLNLIKAFGDVCNSLLSLLRYPALIDDINDGACLDSCTVDCLQAGKHIRVCLDLFKAFDDVCSCLV